MRQVYFSALVFICMTVGCDSQDSTPDECKLKMDGYLEGKFIRSQNNEEIYILSGSSIPESLQDGDKITVTYSSILESYPLQLTVCKVEGI